METSVSPWSAASCAAAESKAVEAVAAAAAEAAAAVTGADDKLAAAHTQSADSMVGRCRLTVSKPVSKAPMVSALETG